MKISNDLNKYNNDNNDDDYIGDDQYEDGYDEYDGDESSVLEKIKDLNWNIVLPAIVAVVVALSVGVKILSRGSTGDKPKAQEGCVTNLSKSDLATRCSAKS